MIDVVDFLIESEEDSENEKKISKEKKFFKEYFFEFCSFFF